MKAEELKFCHNCPCYDGCDYIKADRKSSCGFLGYFIEGYETATERAVQWYRENLLPLHSKSFRERIIEDFKKAMSE